jgi:hypothetical protein
MMFDLILELVGNVAYKRSRFIRRVTWGGLVVFFFIVVCGFIYSWASA